MTLQHHGAALQPHGAAVTPRHRWGATSCSPPTAGAPGGPTAAQRKRGAAPAGRPHLVHHVDAVVQLLALQEGVQVVEQVAQVRLAVAVRDDDGGAGTRLAGLGPVATAGLHCRVLGLDLLQGGHPAEGHRQGADCGGREGGGRQWGPVGSRGPSLPRIQWCLWGPDHPIIKGTNWAPVGSWGSQPPCIQWPPLGHGGPNHPKSNGPNWVTGVPTTPNPMAPIGSQGSQPPQIQWPQLGHRGPNHPKPNGPNWVTGSQPPRI